MKLINRGINLATIAYIGAFTALSKSLSSTVNKSSGIEYVKTRAVASLIGYKELSVEHQDKLISDMLIIAETTSLSVNEVVGAINNLVRATEIIKEKHHAFSGAIASIQKEKCFINEFKQCTGNDFINKKINKQKKKWQL